MSAPINNPFAVKSIHRNYIIALFMAAKFNAMMTLLNKTVLTRWLFPLLCQ